MTELRINDFVTGRLADPRASGALVADPTWRDLLVWLNEQHHIDGKLESWYWLERRCEYCKWGWMQHVPDRAPSEIGPEKGCPTIRRIANLFADHPDFDRDNWLEPAPKVSLWRSP